MTQPASSPRSRVAAHGTFLAALLALVLAVGLVGPVVSAGPASAAEPRRTPVNIETRPTTEGGKGTFRGRIVWLSRTRARLLGELNDVCPGDGFAAVLQVFSSRGIAQSRRTKVDDRRCDAPGTVPVKWTFKSARGEPLRFLFLGLSLRNSDGTWFDIQNRKRYNPFLRR